MKNRPFRIVLLAFLALAAFCLTCLAGLAALDTLGLFPSIRTEAPQAAAPLLGAPPLPSTSQPSAEAAAGETPLPAQVEVPAASETSPPPTVVPTPTPPPAPSPTPTPTPAPSPTPTPPLAAGPEAACLPAGSPAESGVVEQVIDGDTIEVRLGEQVYSLRYIGIDAPEGQQSESDLAARATAGNQALVGGQMVTLLRDVSETDRYGRLLRYVIAGGVFINYELVRQGLAEASAYPPDVACAETFLQAQQAAQAEGLGLWAAIAPPEPQETAIAGQGGSCDPAYPEVCIAPPPPDLDCPDIPYRRFQVLPPDPHRFDRDADGVGCEGS